MKKLFLAFSTLAIAATLFVSCEKEEEANDLTTNIVGTYNCMRVTDGESEDCKVTVVKQTDDFIGISAETDEDGEPVFEIFSAKVLSYDEGIAKLEIVKNESVSFDEITGSGEIAVSESTTLISINIVGDGETIDFLGTKQ